MPRKTRKQITSLPDTKPTPGHSYYQYIHPYDVTADKLKYRFMGVVKNGEVLTSKVYIDIKQCHEDLRRLIENE